MAFRIELPPELQYAKGYMHEFAHHGADDDFAGLVNPQAKWPVEITGFSRQAEPWQLPSVFSNRSAGHNRTA